MTFFTDTLCTSVIRLIAALSIALMLPLRSYGEVVDSVTLNQVANITEEEIAANHIPGAVILIGQGDHILYSQAFGRRAIMPASEPMTLDTIFDIASLTKVVATTPAILQLVERGALSLDAPVARYWPAFSVNGKQKITIRQLLTHTSGLPAGIDMRGDITAEAIRHRIATIKPVSRIGGDPLYSDINFAILGELVRRISGQTLDIYAANHIFKPLGMTDTSFLPPSEKLERIAPTMWDGKNLRRGLVHDPLASHLHGVSGNAGVFSTAADLGQYAKVLMAGGTPVLSAAMVKQMFTPQTLQSMPARSLGWRMEPPLVLNRAALPPVGTVSHLGYTGTGMWMDLVNGIYVIILTNRVLSEGGGDAAPLRLRVIATIANALGHLQPEQIVAQYPELAPRVTSYIPKKVQQSVLTGIDVLEAQDFIPLQHLRIGLLTNRSGVDHDGRRTIDVLQHAPSVTLTALFSPEHGLGANQEGKINDDVDSLSGLPIFSLYGATRRPSVEMLSGLDAIVVDLQDAGARFYTYTSTLAYVMEAAAERGLRVFVLDRPNPVNGINVQGPTLDADSHSFTGYWPLPIRHGLTLGEFARLYNAESRIGANLTVIPMQNYQRALWYDDTGLPWVPPSPNLISLNSTTLYPGIGMLEGAEVSVGRGTDLPFEVVGAPWIDNAKFAAALEHLALPGLHFLPISFTPENNQYAGQYCYGVRIIISDRNVLNTPALGLAMTMTLNRLYPQQFNLEKTLGNFGNQATLDAIRSGQKFDDIISMWGKSENDFIERRAAYLLYK